MSGPGAVMATAVEQSERLQAALDELTQHRELLDLLYKASRRLDSWEEFSWLSEVMAAAAHDQTRIADLVVVLREAIRRTIHGYAALGDGPNRRGGTS